MFRMVIKHIKTQPCPVKKKGGDYYLRFNRFIHSLHYIALWIPPQRWYDYYKKIRF
jgi:hypothetical protein